MGKPLVLVVDDQPGVRRLLYEVFFDDGFDVELASGGAEALRKIKAVLPQVMLLDVRMPGISGLDVLKELGETNQDVKVVVMTAYGEMDLVREALKMGAQWYINKPFDLEELRCMVKMILADIPQCPTQADVALVAN